MSWNLLKTNYRDATWTGQKKYILSENEDGTYSIEDVTEYQNYDQSLFGASDANAINSAINAIRLAMDDDTMLPKATRDLLGGIKVGNYLTVEDDGTLSINVNALAIALKGGTASTGSTSSGTGTGSGTSSSSNDGASLSIAPGSYTYGSGGDVGAVNTIFNGGGTNQTFFVNLADGMNYIALELLNNWSGSKGRKLTHVEVDWGDGITEALDFNESTSKNSFAHIYTSGGLKSIRVSNMMTTNNSIPLEMRIGFGVMSCEGYTARYTNYYFRWKIIGQLFNPNITRMLVKGCSRMKYRSALGMSPQDVPDILGTSYTYISATDSKTIALCTTSEIQGTHLTVCKEVPTTVETLVVYVEQGNVV